MSKILNILLQRNDTRYPWGFTIAGTPGDLYIDKVSPGALSSQHLNVGDKVLQIAGIDSTRIDVWQAQDIVDQPQRNLEIIVLKSRQSTRRFSDGSDSIPSSSESVPWKASYPRSSSPVNGRKAKNLFWERCNSLSSRDFHNSTESDLFRTRDRHSRSHSIERTNSATPASYSSNTEVYNNSVVSEPLWAYKTGKRNTWSNWERAQSCTDDSTKRFPDTRTEEKAELSSTDFTSRRNSFSSENNLSDKFEELSLNKPRKFPWFDTLDEFNSSEEFGKIKGKDFISTRSEFSSSFSERSSIKSYKKKESKTYEFEENTLKSSEFKDHFFNEQGKEYIFRKTGSISKESSPILDERNRSRTPAGFYENHREELKMKEERSFENKRGQSVEREELLSRRYSRELSSEKSCSETAKSELKGEFRSASRISETRASPQPRNQNHFVGSKFDRSSSNTPTNENVDQTAVNNSYGSFNNNHEFKSIEKDVRLTDELEQINKSSECFSKSVFNADKRSIFDARKYWSCTSPTSESKFVFVPLQKSTGNPATYSAGVQQTTENQDTTQSNSTEQTTIAIEADQDHGRQQNQVSGGNNLSPTPPVSSAPGFDSAPVSFPSAGPPAPPPPPPPPASGGVPPPPPPLGLVHIPAIRLRSEIPDVRREPPAAIQNAMMKDKKPFTYTPGGLDLSEIRSPRMQRRISRNAQNTDSTQSPPVQQTQQPNRPVSLPPSAAAAMQPQIAIPVFPPTSPNANHSAAPPPPPAPPVNNVQCAPPPPPPQSMAVPKMQPQRQSQPMQQNQNTGSIYVPPVQQQSQLRSQLGSLYIPPVHQQQQQQQQEIPSAMPTPPPPVAQLNKAPTPWLSRQSQAQKEVPPWVNREDNNQSPVTSPQVQNNQRQQQFPQQQPQGRIIPIQIEGRTDPAQPNTRIIPITIEGTPSPKQNISQPNFQQQQQQFHQQASVQHQQQKFQQPQPQHQQKRPVYVHNKFNPPSPSIMNENPSIANGRASQPSQQNWGGSGDGSSSPAPVQSRSFRVLQKITDTDAVDGDQVDSPYNSQGVPLSQLRKLQLSDDDRALMDKVKTQVDEDNFLHTESEPRYRGAAIPSRAFRMLQNMTDNAGNVPHGPNDNHLSSSNRRSMQQDAPSPAQPYVHPSEQQVEEPRMYTGSAIPSRSFRMLQAMTGPDPSGRPDESEY